MRAAPCGADGGGDDGTRARRPCTEAESAVRIEHVLMNYERIEQALIPLNDSGAAKNPESCGGGNIWAVGKARGETALSERDECDSDERADQRADDQREDNSVPPEKSADRSHEFDVP